jgi:uncharacterized protein involved in outer membrane biogenesis
MRTLFKIILALVLLICALAAYLNFAFKPEALTASLSQKIYEKTARTLSIKGAATFNIFPQPRVRFPHLALTEPNSTQLFLELKQVDAALAWLPLLSLKAELSHLSIGELSYHTRAGVLRASEVNAQVLYSEQQANLNHLNANFYGGKLVGQASYVNASKKLTLDVQTENTKLDALLQDAVGKPSVSGLAKLNTQLSMTASDANTLKNSLNGQAKIDIADAQFVGVNLADWWRQWRSLRGQAGMADAQQKNDFSALNATFKIKDGVAFNDDLNAQSPFVRLSGAGKINLAADSIDYLAQANFVNNPLGQGATQDAQEKNLNIPVQINGTLAQPNFVPNWGVVLNTLAGATVQKKLEDLANEKLGGKGAEVVKDLLKGLFGK